MDNYEKLIKGVWFCGYNGYKYYKSFTRHIVIDDEHNNFIGYCHNYGEAKEIINNMNNGIKYKKNRSGFLKQCN